MKLNDLKIAGLTAAGASIASVNIEYLSDCSWAFTVDGQPYSYAGNNEAVNILLQAIFTGPGGFTATTTRTDN